MVKRQHTKIIATLGDPELTYKPGIYTLSLKHSATPTLEEVVDLFFSAGVDVIRINLAHFPHEEVTLRNKFSRIKSAILKAEREHGRRVGVLADLGGPKIRFRRERWLLPRETLYIVFDERPETIVAPETDGGCAPKESVARVHLDQVEAPEEAARTIINDLREKLAAGGDQILAFVGDNDATLRVERVIDDDKIVCAVLALRSEDRVVGGNKGFTIRGTPKRIPGFTKQDEEMLSWLLDADYKDHGETERIVSHIGISFCQTRDDARRVLECIIQKMREYESTQKLSGLLVGAPHVIAKIETEDGVEHIDKILYFADGAMIARGDLALELETAELPEKSKWIVDQCNLRGKAVIMATEMLESMRRNVECARPEATDVFNAVVDGADALMLSDETSDGMYPAHAISKMRELARRAEDFAVQRVSVDARLQTYFNKLEEIHARAKDRRDGWDEIWDEYGRLYRSGNLPNGEWQFVQEFCKIKTRRLEKQNSTDRISHAACIMSADDAVIALVAPTMSGRTARMLARFRPGVWILGLPHTEFVARKLALDWGVLPGKIIPLPTNRSHAQELIEMSKRVLLEEIKKANTPLTEEGELEGKAVVFTCGTPLGVVGTTNLIQRWDLPRSDPPVL